NKVWAYICIGGASLVHNIIFFSTGKAIGNNWDGIKDFLRVYNKTVLIVLLIGFMIYGICWGLKIYNRKLK
ncbi:MAG: hypothetical protein K0R09_3239, partial [Clostridiales bacterium]|nr:hypothetical protein [Clostridiales bacterium]